MAAPSSSLPRPSAAAEFGDLLQSAEQMAAEIDPNAGGLAGERERERKRGGGNTLPNQCWYL